MGFLILITFVTLFETDEWWIRLWDFPRLQIAALIVLALVMVTGIGPRRGWSFWGAAGAGLAALAWQLSHVAVFLPGWPVEVRSAKRCEPGNRIRLLNANVLMTNRDYGRLVTEIERLDPDMVLLLEPDAAWVAAMRPAFARYPHRAGEPLANLYGIYLMSKLPLESVEVRHLLQPDIPSIRAKVRLRSGEVVDFHGVHPEPPLPGDDSGERDAELVMVGREVRSAGRATIVLGDLNDVAWSRTTRLFKDLAAVKDARVGRGLYPTYPATLPLLAWPLDHLFVSPHFELIGIDRLRDVGSDHYPMLFEVCLTKNPEQRMAAPRAHPEVREDARDQVAEGREERADENDR